MSKPDDPYWNDHSDSYQYPNSTILRNIPALQNQKALDDFELNASLVRIPEVLAHIQGEPVTMLLWQDIHRLLFQDVYEWAGQTRTVQLAKGGTLFAHPQHITSQGEHIFSELKNEKDLHSLSKQETCKRLAYYFSECNALHPFREGNGRTQKLLFGEIARRLGYHISWKDLSPEDHLKAVIEGYHNRYDMLEAIFATILHKEWP